MRRSTRWVALCALALGLSVSGQMARADDAAVIESRQAVMKAQGKDMAAIKAFTEDKGELAAAQAAGADLVAEVAKIPGLFPKGTGMAEHAGKSWAKPAVWTDADKFAAQVKVASEKAAALDKALKGGDKAAITAAFGDMGKNGCAACHESFREKKPS